MTAEFETERSQNVLAVLDAGRLMATEVGGLTKLGPSLKEAQAEMDTADSRLQELDQQTQKLRSDLVAQRGAASDSQAKAFLVGVREAVPIMGDGGRILATTYAQGSRTGGLQPWVAMGAAKSALESLCRYFAVALARRGITVNAISPGWTEDSVLNTLPKQAQDLIRSWHESGWTPMGRLGTPEDVGNVVSLLCSEKAQWITGQVIYADGGASLMNPEVPTEIQIG